MLATFFGLVVALVVVAFIPIMGMSLILGLLTAIIHPLLGLAVFIGGVIFLPMIVSHINEE